MTTQLQQQSSSANQRDENAQNFHLSVEQFLQQLNLPSEYPFPNYRRGVAEVDPRHDDGYVPDNGQSSQGENYSDKTECNTSCSTARQHKKKERGKDYDKFRLSSYFSFPSISKMEKESNNFDIVSCPSHLYNQEMNEAMKDGTSRDKCFLESQYLQSPNLFQIIFGDDGGSCSMNHQRMLAKQKEGFGLGSFSYFSELFWSSSEGAAYTGQIATKWLQYSSNLTRDVGPCMWSSIRLSTSLVSPAVSSFALVYLLLHLGSSATLPCRRPSWKKRQQLNQTLGWGETSIDHKRGENHTQKKSADSFPCYIILCKISAFAFRRLYASVIHVALICSAFMIQDYMYIFEFGRVPLFLLYLALCALIWITWPSIYHRLSPLDWSPEQSKRISDEKTMHLEKRRGPEKQEARISRLLFFRNFALPLLLSSTYLSLASVTMDTPFIDRGLYYDTSKKQSQEIVQAWPEALRTYDDGRGTPWIFSGDMRTAIPYLLSKEMKQPLVRRWVRTDDDEAIALDFAFPRDGIVRASTPIYIVLHGLNGGSTEPYVQDFIHRRTVEENSTVAVMITRGLMDTPVRGNHLPHFARTADLATVAHTIRNAVGENGVIAAVGYSMGGITLANYVARSGSDCPLNAAVSISGALDTREEVKYDHSTNVWQPFLAKTLRDTLMAKFRTQLSQKLSQKQIDDIAFARDMVQLDTAMFVAYNDDEFRTAEHYYSEMGAMGDFSVCPGCNEKDFPKPATGPTGNKPLKKEKNKTYGASNARIENISVPLLVVNALDDPIGYWRTLVGGYYRHPSQVVQNHGQGNIFILITKRGGHVGWPLGWNPAQYGWLWMSTVSRSFVEAVVHHDAKSMRW